MLSFSSDYITGAHPDILKRLSETNNEALPGYGSDIYCESAKEKIKKACKRPNVEVELLTGGTQTNYVVVSTLLNDISGVIAAETGHINAHEAGAIEFSGHKVMTIPGHDGKIDAHELEAFIDTFYEDENHTHMVYPGMVYISHPTEYGTLYTKAELKALHDICKRYMIPLFLDGARLAYALMSKNTDVTLSDLCDLTDVFYIGGTKCGAMCGEAVVFTHNNKPFSFITSVKKRGALLAKGRLLGLQFDTLFTDDLYYKIGKTGIDTAEELKNILKRKNIRFFKETDTNQQFVILENKQMEALKERVAFGFWEKYDENHTVVRFATCWSTKEDDLKALEALL